MSDPNAESSNLLAKVSEWLNEQGYPLEFEAAATFRRAGFSVRQGAYVRTPDTEKPREIDVTACVDSSEDCLIRVYHLVECKWSQTKPWIVFTSAHGIGPAACVSQTISSDFGSAILWKEAGRKELQDLALFATPKRSGFNGRQAFSQGKDHFYDAMHSVTTLSTLRMKYYDEHRREGQIPESAVVAFPVIVVDGELYEAYYDESKNDVTLAGASHLRCHWKGSPAWHRHATVDIVTLDHLQEFATKRRTEVDQLISLMRLSRDEIFNCFTGGKLEEIEITDGARGTLGLHRLFRELKAHQPDPPPR